LLVGNSIKLKKRRTGHEISEISYCRAQCSSLTSCKVFPDLVPNWLLFFLFSVIFLQDKLSYSKHYVFPHANAESIPHLLQSC
jgi:hypothetical protein